MQKIICILFQVFLVVSASAQVVISGKITEKSNADPVVAANVVIKNANNKIIKFSITDERGAFKIVLDSIYGGMTIHVSMIGLKSYSAPLDKDFSHLDIRMEDGTLQLKEVVVEAGRIRESNDTITYRVSGFAEKQDRTIGDVLRRMPGIDVSVNGNIKYQGEDINKFYIEGNDLLGGKYGIATNGISHEDIGAVEIMENHQPFQVLRGLSFSDKAALNLKLKSKSKAAWLINGSLGGGWSTQPKGALWNNELFLMAIMSKYQTISTYKSNNDGTDLQNQLIDFFIEPRGTALGNYFSIQLPSTPSLKKSRTYFNRSHMLSSSHLWKVKANEIKAQVDYYNQRATASSASTTTYFLDKGNKVITEERTGKEHNSQLTGLFSIESNQKKYYLSNILKTELKWDDISLDMTGSIPNSSYAKIPDFYISNNLKTIKRFRDNHLVTFTSVNEWESSPQQLNVNYKKGQNIDQHISEHAFYTNEKAEYGFYTHGFKISFEGGFDGFIRGMESKVILNELTINDVMTNYFSVYLSPKLEYSSKRIEITLSYPFNYKYFKFNQKLGNQSKYFHAPALFVRWKQSPRFSISAVGGYGTTPIDLNLIHDKQILTDYHTLNDGLNDFYVNSRKYLSGRLVYRNVQRGFFANALAYNSWNSIPYTSIQHFQDDFISYSFYYSNSKSQSLNVTGNLSKTLNLIHGSISTYGGYFRMKKSLISENVPTQYDNSTWHVGGKIYGNIADKVSISYDLKYQNSNLHINQQATQDLDKYIHNFAVTITPIEAVSLQLEGEYYRDELTEENYKRMFMLDSKFSWHISKHLELVASVTNILNRKTYSYVTHGAISSFESTRHLRGREFMFTLYLKK